MFTKVITFGLTVVVVLCLTVFSAGAQEKSKGEAQGEKAEGTPTGKVTIKTSRVTVGIGYTWGDGTLKFKGKEYKFKVSGLNMIGLGYTSMNVKGEVYNLESLSDFPGKYFGVEGGATLIKGSAWLVIKNSKGVVLNLKGKQKGADLRLGDQGLSITPARE